MLDKISETRRKEGKAHLITNKVGHIRGVFQMSQCLRVRTGNQYRESDTIEHLGRASDIQDASQTRHNMLLYKHMGQW